MPTCVWQTLPRRTCATPTYAAPISPKRSLCVRLSWMPPVATRTPAYRRGSSGRRTGSRWFPRATAFSAWRGPEANLALPLGPGGVGHLQLPRLVADHLRRDQLLDHRARVAMERLLQQRFGFRDRGSRGVHRALDDAFQHAFQLTRGRDPIHQSPGERLLGRDALVQQRQLFGAAHADDAR